MTDKESESGSVSGLRRSNRTKVTPVNLSPKWKGTSYMMKHLTGKVNQNSTIIEQRYNLYTSEVKERGDLEYSPIEAIVLVNYMFYLNISQDIGMAKSFGQQYQLSKGLKLFGDKGKEAAQSEIQQLHSRKCFKPISVNEMTSVERRRAQRAMMLLTEKRDGTKKGRAVFDGRATREWLSKEDSASPTATLEGIMLTLTIDAYEGRDVMTADVPNAFIQTEMPEVKPGDERVIMKITGVLVDMLVQVDSQLYGPHVVFEKGHKVVYVQVMKAIYGMLTASLLWYKKFRKDLEGIGFKFNDYDACIANRIKDGSQQTIRFHVDDIMSSHMNPQVNDKFGHWLERMYGEYKAVKPLRGKVHDYLGMKIDFGTKSTVIIDMVQYVHDMIMDFPVKITKTSKTPAGEKLMEVGNGKLLDKCKAEAFHTTVAKGLFLCKRARPDIQPTIAFLSTRVISPTETDWKKLIRLLEYLLNTKELKLNLRAVNNLRMIK